MHKIPTTIWKTNRATDYPSASPNQDWDLLDMVNKSRSPRDLYIPYILVHRFRGMGLLSLARIGILCRLFYIHQGDNCLAQCISEQFWDRIFDAIMKAIMIVKAIPSETATIIHLDLCERWGRSRTFPSSKMRPSFSLISFFIATVRKYSLKESLKH